MQLPTDISTLAAALGIGLLTGLERERRQANASVHPVAGLRTFAITSLAGWCATTINGTPLLAALTLGVAVLLAVAYFRIPGEPAGLTTEIALLLVLLLGALCTKRPALAAGLGVVLTGLLAWREDLHQFARTKLTEIEIREGLVLAGAVLVILPLVPDRFMGPYQAINPRTIWLLFVLMMGIGAASHIAIRVAGSQFGLPLAGFISGFASSTATIASMGSRTKRHAESLSPAIAAATLSCSTTMLLMVVVLAAIDPRLLPPLLPSLSLAFMAACAWAAVFGFAKGAEHGTEELSRHVFDWRLAIGAATIIAAVQLASALCFQWLGNPGLLLSTALSGFADVHAAAASAAVLVPAGKLAPTDVTLPVLMALSTNSVSKAVMAWIMGNRPFAFRVIAGLALVLGALWTPYLAGYGI